MSHAQPNQAWGVLLTAVLVGCSPPLNWREVQLDRMAVFLPCKPDRAQRSVQLANGSTPMEMAGCEADGAMFAASHIRAVRVDQVDALLQAWQTASFANMRATLPVKLPVQTALVQHRAEHWTASGTRASGEPVQARMAWWVSGSDVYHVAVYAEKLTEAQTDTLFGQVKIQ